jgi:hypothetical protein
MKNLIDYIYYRVHKWYESLNDDIPDEGALAILTLMSLFLILDLVALSMYIGDVRFQRKYDLFYIVSTLMITGSIYLFYRYRYRKISIGEFKEKWGNESRKIKLRKGIIITIVFFTLIFIPFYFGGHLIE